MTIGVVPPAGGVAVVFWPGDGAGSSGAGSPDNSGGSSWVAIPVSIAAKASVTSFPKLSPSMDSAAPEVVPDRVDMSPLDAVDVGFWDGFFNSKRLGDMV